MANFVVSARKYRPLRFEDVVGQSHVTNTLTNAIKNNHLAQAFLFCGPRGVGKTTCARILARVINEYAEPKDALEAEQFQSFNVYELDAASNNSVEDIRGLIEQVRYAPQQGKYKVYIIDEVHMLSQSAFNAFLKTLEEPPSYAIFILATTEKHKIIPTILSRCQIFDFRRIEIKDMVDYLKSISQRENVEVDDDALHIIAQKADGGLRDALSIFDRVVSYTEGKITLAATLDILNILDYDYYFKVTDALLKTDIQSVLNTYNEIIQKGFEGDTFIIGLAEHFRNILVCKDESTIRLLEVGESLKTKYAEQAKVTSGSFLLNALKITNECDIYYKPAKNKRLHVEMALIKMCYADHLTSLASEPTEVKKKRQPSVEQSVKAETSPKQVDSTVSAENNPTPPKEKEVIAVAEKEELIVKKEAEVIIKTEEISLGPSLKLKSLDQLNVEVQSQEKKKENLQDSQSIVLDEKVFKNSWQKYIEQIKEAGKINYLTVLEGLQPEIVKGRVEVRVKSLLDNSTMEEERTDLVEFLKTEMNLPKIELVVHIDKSLMDDTPAKPYTAKDKFNRLAEKNPNIIELKNRLGLNLEY